MPIVPVDPSTIDPADAARIAELRGGVGGGAPASPAPTDGGGRIVPAPPGFTPPGAPSAAPAAPAAPAQPAYVSDYPFEKRRADQPAPQESWKRATLRHGIEMAGGYGGMGVGAALGLAPTFAALMGGNVPAAGAIGLGATFGGEATGLTAADAINALIDKYAYGRTTDFSLVNAVKDEALNMAGTVGGRIVLEGIPAIWRGVEGRRAAEEALGKATEVAGGMKREFEEQTGAIREREAAQTATAQEAAVKEAQPAAKREIIETATGRTPETAARTQVPVSTLQPSGTYGAPPEHIAAKKGFQDTYNGIRERQYKGYEKEYDTLLGKEKLKPAKDTSDVLKEIRRQELWQQQNAQIPYSADARRVIARAKALLDPKGMNEQDYKALGLSGKTYMEGGALDPKDPFKGLQEVEEDPDAKELTPKGPGVSFGQLMALRSYARRMAAKSTDDISAKALSEIEDSTTKSFLKQGLSAEDVRKLGDLNSRYRDFKLTFDHVTGGGVSKADDAVAAADHVFSNPKLTERMWRDAQTAAPRPGVAAAPPAQPPAPAGGPIPGRTGVGGPPLPPEPGQRVQTPTGSWVQPGGTAAPSAGATINEREQLRTAFGDWAQTNPKKVFTDDPVEAQKRATAYGPILFPGKSPEDAAKALTFVNGKIETLANSPQAMADYEAGFNETLQGIQTKAAFQVRNVGIGLLERMGPLGSATLRQVNQARDPIEQARIVDDFFTKMDDREFNRLVAQKQGIFGPPVIQGMLPKEQQQAVGGMWARMKSNWPAYLMATGVTAMMFPHAGVFYGVMGTGGAAMALRQRYQNYVIRSLASRYADEAMSSMSKNAFRQLGSLSVRALADVGGSKVSKATLPQMFPGLAEQPTGEGTPGPTSRAGGFSLPGEGTAYAEELPAPKAGPAIREAQNREIAPSPGGADRAGEIDKGLVSGRAPADVTRDLERGRLSTDEIGKLLRRSSSSDPGAAVAGIPLTDLMSAAETGAPWEKQMLVPLLQQRMQQELPKLGNKTTQANLARRFSVLQREAGTGAPSPPQAMQ